MARQQEMDREKFDQNDPRWLCCFGRIHVLKGSEMLAVKEILASVIIIFAYIFTCVHVGAQQNIVLLGLIPAAYSIAMVFAAGIYVYNVKRRDIVMKPYHMLPYLIALPLGIPLLMFGIVLHVIKAQTGKDVVPSVLGTVFDCLAILLSIWATYITWKAYRFLSLSSSSSGCEASNSVAMYPMSCRDYCS